MDPTVDVRRRPSMASMIAWCVFCFVMWFWAIVGPLVIVGGVTKLLFDPPWLDIQLGHTPMQPDDLGLPVVLSAVGLVFVVLRLRGHIHFGDRD